MNDDSVRLGVGGYVHGRWRSAWCCMGLGLAVLTGICCGCLTPVTARLDAIHAELQLTHQEMAEVNARLNETNQRLADIEALLKRFPLLKPADALPEPVNP